MLSEIIIIGLVMTVTEIVKEISHFDDKDYKAFIYPLLVFFLGGFFNVLNAQIFGGMELIQALQEGLILGASAGGIYSLGKEFISKEE